MTSQVEPPVSQWHELIRRNEIRLHQEPQVVAATRRAMIIAAAAYTEQLINFSEKHGLPAPQLPSVARLSEAETSVHSPVLMTGHQPTIFHSGIAQKYRVVDEYLKQHEALGVSVIIDTDDGDPAAIRYPRCDDVQGASASQRATSMHLELASLSENAGLYRAVHLRSAPEIVAMGEEIAGHLEKLNLHDNAARAQALCRAYAQCGGTNAMEATLAIRRSHGIGSQLLDIPLSIVARLDTSREFFAEIWASARTFHTCYNATLHGYRTAHAIENQANPFPDLGEREGWLELPFWILDHTPPSRSALWIKPGGNGYQLRADNGVDIDLARFHAAHLDPALDDGDEISVVPRHALITVMLRLLYCDLFVHGTGGGKYDQFTDELIRAWWRREPPAFAVASATRYLLADQRNELQRCRTIERDLRAMTYHPQRYFGQDLYTAHTEARLLSLVQEKEAAVVRLKQLKERGESAREFDQRIRGIASEMRSLVEADFEEPLTRLRSYSAASIRAIESREYPVYFWPEDGNTGVRIIGGKSGRF